MHISIPSIKVNNTSADSKYRTVCCEVIIYHDFLPTPRMGSHVKSGKTHTQAPRHTTQPIHLTAEPRCSAVAPLLQLIPTASCKGIPPLSMRQPPECRWFIYLLVHLKLTPAVIYIFNQKGERCPRITNTIR